MRILVTGGYGFIGCNFIRHLLQTSESMITNLDKLTYAGVRSSLRDVEDEGRYTFLEGDVCSRDDVRKAMAGCEAVVHFAAASHVDRSIQDVTPFIQTNIIGTSVLLEEARRQDVRKFVLISTDEVYGQIEHGSFKETDALNPRNPYAATKAAADRLAYSFFATYGLPVVITRSSNNFGPYQFPEKVIPLFITNLLAGRKLPVYGSGANVRDWLYVEDNCAAIEQCLRQGRNGEVYNIGGGNEIANLELARMILREVGMPETMIEFVRDRPGHDLRYALDCTKINEQLGWRPQHGFANALRATVRWYRDNQWWWKPLIQARQF